MLLLSVLCCCFGKKHLSPLRFIATLTIHMQREGHFEEAAKQSVTLEHVDVDVFGHFVHWLYTQEVKVSPFTGDPKNLSGATKVAKDLPGFDVLVKLWILGDYLQAPKLQNSTMEEFIAESNRLRITTLGVGRYIYENTCSGSMLRKYLVDRCVWIGIRHTKGYPDTDLPAEMLLDIVMTFNDRHLQGFSNAISPLKSATNYHVKAPKNTESSTESDEPLSNVEGK